MEVKKKTPFRYLANKKTKEVHRVKRMEGVCYASNIMAGHNALYCTRLLAWYLIRFRGYNGCRWCYKEKDTDKLVIKTKCVK